MDIKHLVEPALTASVDLIAFVVHGDPAKDPLWKAFDSALGGSLTAAAKAERFDGKSSQTLTIWTKGPLKAQRVLALGGGGRADLKTPGFRDLAAVTGQTASRLGATSVGFVMPAVGIDLTALSVFGGALGATLWWRTRRSGRPPLLPPLVLRWGGIVVTLAFVSFLSTLANLPSLGRMHDYLGALIGV